MSANVIYLFPDRPTRAFIEAAPQLKERELKRSLRKEPELDETPFRQGTGGTPQAAGSSCPTLGAKMLDLISSEPSPGVPEQNFQEEESQDEELWAPWMESNNPGACT